MQVLRDEPLARHAWWRVGGPVDRYVLVDTPEELATELRANGAPLLVLGNGSNLLVPDAGLRGTVLKLGSGFATTEVLGALDDTTPAGGVAGGGSPPPQETPTHDRAARRLTRVRVGAGLANTVLLARLGKLGLGGAGCLAGVPGTVGGSIAMNAGTVLGEIECVLENVEGVDRNGEFRVIERNALPMVYREGGLPHGFLVTHATLRLSPEGVAEEAAAIRHHLDRRKATQPLHLPSCGSTFRNPPGTAAGALIEAAGLKGHRVGGAQISEKHANFIVNLGEATASDVMGCIRAAWEGVRAHAGVTMVPEVHVVGDWDAGVWPLA